MNEWVTVCPTDKDTTRTKTTPTQPNNGRNNDESDENGNNGCNHNKSGGESNGSGSGFNGSGNRDDDDDKDEANKPKNNTEDDDEDGEIDRFMYFLTHTIKTCDDAELRVVLSTFSNACIEKVLAGIQDVYNQKIRISKMRQPMRTKKLKQKKRYHFKSNSANDREPISNLNSLQIKSQYQITKSFTNDIIPSKVIGIPAIGSDLSVGDIGRIAYDYIIKSVAINEDNCYVNPKNTMRIFNFGLHLKQSKQDAYFIAKRQSRDRRRYDWLVDEILTQTEIGAKYSDVALKELPNPIRIDASFEMAQVQEEIMKLKAQPQNTVIEYTKWRKICIYGQRNNKRRMQLMYTEYEFEARCREFIMRADKDEITLFPIVMFDRKDNVLIQYAMIISIETNVDIAVSFKYDVSAKSPLSVVGIHLDKDLIYKQHQVLCKSQTCRHLSRFKSSINYMHIGNCDDLLNQKKALQKHNKALRETSKELQVKLDQMHSSTSYDSSYFNQRSLLSYGTSVNPSSSSDRYSHTLGQSMFDSLSDVTDVSNPQPYTPIDPGSRLTFSPLMRSDVSDVIPNENELMNVEDASVDTDIIERDEDRRDSLSEKIGKYLGYFAASYSSPNLLNKDPQEIHNQNQPNTKPTFTNPSMAHPRSNPKHYPQRPLPVPHHTIRNKHKRNNDQYATKNFDKIDYIVHLPLIDNPNERQTRFLLAMDYTLPPRDGLGIMDTALEHIVHYFDMNKAELIFCEMWQSVCLFIEFGDTPKCKSAYNQLCQFFKTIFYVEDLNALEELWICSHCKHYNQFDEYLRGLNTINDKRKNSKGDEYIYWCNRCKNVNHNTYKKIKYSYQRATKHNQKYIKSNRDQIGSISNLNNVHGSYYRKKSVSQPMVSGVIDATIRDRANEMDKEIEMKQPTPLPNYNYCEAFTKDDETFLFEKGNPFDCRERLDATFSDSTSEMDIRSPDPSKLTFKHAHQPHRVHSDTSTSTLAANASKCQSSPSHDDITCDKSDLMDKQRQTKDASSVSITTPHGVNHQADDRDEKPFDRDAMNDQLSACVNETDRCEDNVDARVQVDVSQANAKKPTLHKLLQSLRYKVHGMPSSCLDLEDEYEEMNAWMIACPTDNDTTRTKATPTHQNNNRDSDESDKNGNNNSSNPNKSGGRSNGSGSGFDGSDNHDDDDDKDEEKESKDHTEDDHNEYQNEDDETDQFTYFLMHTIETCNDAELRVVLSSFSDSCMDKVLECIQTVYNQKIRVSKMRQSMKGVKKQKQKRKSKSKSKTHQNINIPSPNPFRIKSQYQVYKSFTSDDIPSKVIGIPGIGPDLGDLAYDFIIKSIAINIKDNCYVNPQNTMRIFNFGLYFRGSNQNAYLIAKRQSHERKRHGKRYDWLVNEISTETEICAKYNDIKLPKCSDIKLYHTSYEMKEVQKRIHHSIVACTQWNRIHIYGQTNHKRRMKLLYTNDAFMTRCRDFITGTDKDEITMFPIVMFDKNDNVLIQYVMIVSIEKTVDIAVSFKYDVSAESPLTVVGIHLDKDLIRKQHQVLCTSLPCRHLSCFKSSINYMHIGNCDDVSNQKKALQKQKEDLQQQLRNHKETIRNLQMRLDEMSLSASCDSPHIDSSSRSGTLPVYSSLSDASSSVDTV